MRRTIFLALVAALLFVPTAAHAQADPIEIIRDCEDDGALQGKYSASELREATENLPTDIDEYSDCRDVLSRAIAAKASTSRGPGAGATGGPAADAGPGTGTGTGGGGGGGTSGAAGGGGDAPAPAIDPGTETGPVTPDDWKAVGDAMSNGDRAVDISGHPLSPTLAASKLGRNSLPPALVLVLVSLAVASLAAGAPFARRRVVGNPKP